MLLQNIYFSFITQSFAFFFYTDKHDNGKIREFMMCRVESTILSRSEKRIGSFVTVLRGTKQTKNTEKEVRALKKKHRSINMCHWPRHQKHNHDTE